jgi:Lar family restriction alleviation protein
MSWIAVAWHARNYMLLPCPFCGDSASLTDDDDGHHSPIRWRVECDSDQDCGAQGPVRDTRDLALAEWNSRPHAAITIYGTFGTAKEALAFADDKQADEDVVCVEVRELEPPTVPRGHCGRCDRCGWEFAADACACRPNDCGMRPLPERRKTCAGCGAPFADVVEARRA